MDTVKGMVTSEVIGKAATQTGESPDAMRKAMQGAIPTTFAGLIQSVSAPGGAARIFGAFTEKGASAQGLMATVFGDRGAAVTSALGMSSGVKSGAASHALSLALPLIIGMVGKHVVANRVTAGGLPQMLFGHKKAVLDDPSTPPGLAGALGLGSLASLGGASAEVGEPHVSSAPAPAPEPERARVTSAMERRVEAGPARRSRWALILPVALLGALLVWGIASLTHSRAPRVGVTAPQPTAPTLQNPEVPTVGVAPGSAEAQMAHFLGDPATPLPHTFDFEHLTFDYASAALTPGAAKSIDELAGMLQAHPSARIQVVGHADSSGAEEPNQVLSEARANAVKDALVAKGVAGDRIEVAGAGAQHPVPGAPPQVAANRRVEVVLLSR
jgi:outer membrane protein OmpA-like peptidoglycan-associated protein